MSRKFKIAAVGDIVYDHYFRSSESGLYYEDSRGGGTAWNILLNLRELGHNCFAFGVYGLENPYGESARQELEFFGVNVKNLVGVKNKRSRIIFENLISRTGEHKFGDRCLVCKNRIDDAEIVKIKVDKFFDQIIACQPDILVFDRLTKDRVELVKKVRKFLPNVKAIIDIGRIGYLRFIPNPQIISNLCEFDIVFINEYDALNSLLNRLKIKQGDRRSYLGKLLSTKNLKTLISTAAAEGCTIYSKHVDHINAEKVDNILDSSGAGDALVANFIHLLSKPSMAMAFESGRVSPVIKKAVKELRIVLQNFGARGHIPYTRKGLLQNLKGKKIRKQYLTSNGECAFCFSSMELKSITKIKSPNKGSFSKTISDLNARLLFALEKKDAIQSSKQLLELHGNVFIVGTGGSYASAFYISQVFNEFGEGFAIPIRPFDYVHVNSKRTDAVIIITYSGSTADYESVIKRATELQVPRIIIISHPQKPRLLSYAKDINFFSSTEVSSISYSKPKSKRERGFLSIAGTLLPGFLFLSAALPTLNKIEVYSLIEEKKTKVYGPLLTSIVEELKIKHCLEIYGGGYAWSAMLDMESKLIEGNVCSVQLHEYKDFSHGRFMFSMRNKNPKIIFQTESNEYVSKLINILSSESDAGSVLVIKSRNESLLGGLELLVEVQYLIRRLTEILYEGMNVDITKPKNIPAKGLELYHWKLS